MTDIVEWLRGVEPSIQEPLFGGPMCAEAADEIERLRGACDLYRKNQIADLARLSEAKSLIAELNDHEGAEGWSEGMSERIESFISREKA